MAVSVLRRLWLSASEPGRSRRTERPVEDERRLMRALEAADKRRDSRRDLTSILPMVSAEKVVWVGVRASVGVLVLDGLGASPPGAKGSAEHDLRLRREPTEDWEPLLDSFEMSTSSIQDLRREADMLAGSGRETSQSGSSRKL